MNDQPGLQDSPDSRERALTRRNVLRGVGAGGVTLPLLVACGATSEEPAATPTDVDPAVTPTDVDPAGAKIPTSDVPVGGGTILGDDMVVVTQPSEGEFKAFSARCTHQGCPVQTVTDGRIGCNCHGSAFSIEDGSVLAGPAPSPLESLPVSVEGDQITIG